MAKTWIHNRRGRWRACWYAGGKRKEKTCYSKRQAETYAADIAYRLNRGLVTSLLKVPWANLLVEYFNAKRADKLAESSIREIRSTLNNFERLIGTPASTEITQIMLDDYKAKRGAETKSNSTLNKDLTNIRTFLRFFSDDRAYIRPNLKLQKVRAIIKPVVSLASEDVATLLRYLKRTDPNYYIRALLAVAAGLDASTIDRIAISDIHFDRNTIDTMRPKKKAWHMDRPIQAEVMAEIAHYLLAEVSTGQVRLLPDRYDWRKWDTYRTGAGIDTTFHGLRKTFSSLLQKSGASLSIAQDLLDHASPATTKKYYTDTSDEHQKAVAKLDVGDWINEPEE